MAHIVDAILRLTDHFTPTLVKAQDGLTKYSRQAQRISKDLNKIGNSITQMGTSLNVGVTIPILGMGAASLKATMDFNKSMSKVQALSGATGEQLVLLKDKATELGATTAFSASQVSEAMQYMALAGWKTNDILEGTAGILAAASASGEELAKVSDIITDGLSAFGLEASKANHFADVLSTTATNANTTIGMMGEAFTYAGSVAWALGYSVEDTALAIGIMANSGIKASQAGTALRTMLTELSGTLEITGKNLGTYVIQTSNADGTMKPFRETLESLKYAFSQLSEAERASMAESLVGKNAMAGLLAIMNTSDEAFNSLATAIDNSTDSAERMSDVMLDNLAGQITLIMSGVESLALAIGERLTPYARKLADSIQNVITTFNNVSDEQKDTALKIGAFIAIIPVAILIFGKMVKGVSGAIGAYSRFSKNVQMAGSIFKVIFSPANKIVLTMTAIALVAVLVLKYWEPLKGFFLDLVSKIRSYLEACGVDFNKMKETFSKVVQAIGLAIQILVSFFMGLWEKIKPIVELFGMSIYLTCHQIIGAFQGMMTGVGEIINGLMSLFGGLIDFIVGVFTGNWKKAWQGVKDIFSGIFEGIAGVCKSVINTIIGFINGGIRGLNKLTNFKLPDALGGQQIGLSIPEIPMLYKGTDNWQGGTAMIHDRGAEIVDLPRGSRVYPHDESIKKAFNDGARSNTGVNIAKLADTIIVREDADIDRIANALYNKMKKYAFNRA
ncbi:phage tail tape measure protein [Zhenhengia yiwuensis]|uniref:Phage tail tape measure protein n=1 Tax=Zhenhengia yiwuensis TaxID=2763666 RepID=A0A926IFV2_9FIRM|nr:phage tail tape measure protein [Zhenhengia yiwuensis]MBC8581424.1 phage tail tape measure protein [Zhenhengia yiwuensis]